MIQNFEQRFEPKNKMQDERGPVRDCRACQSALQQSPYPELRKLTCDCDDQDRIMIVGEVSSYYMKQQAQETVLPVAKSLRIHNAVSVSVRVPR
ncbi:hypothetical protein Pla22_28720 [Rubripirellula amarantea]|uniref:BON domain protein n=1 Tax=Rubripirellula amarantea TaxID=2527999 RepID=A0A5C5WWY1_9BACT|nr:hypothetical protein [Rubripirellula amarantea]TWT55217.1 hypothetical protein Pla22_28720 [Rubripirellula amarantea]